MCKNQFNFWENRILKECITEVRIRIVLKWDVFGNLAMFTYAVCYMSRCGFYNCFGPVRNLSFFRCFETSKDMNYGYFYSRVRTTRVCMQIFVKVPALCRCFLSLFYMLDRIQSHRTIKHALQDLDQKTFEFEFPNYKEAHLVTYQSNCK